MPAGRQSGRRRTLNPSGPPGQGISLETAMTATSSPTEPYLRIEALTKQFGVFTALADINFEVAQGEFVCFLGPSGCGKTTLLRAIAGLDIQTFGRVVQAGRDISALPPAERDFGIVFQSYALFLNLSIARNVAYGLENAGLARAEVKRRVEELLELVGLSDQGLKFPAQLSGGQQQRVAVARALATSPGLLLLDEPLSALDAQVRVHLRHEVKALQDRLGITTIMVTHDQEEALSMADRIVVMNHGVIEQIGSPTDIYREPASLFVADFIGETNQLPAVAQAHDSLQIGSARVSVNGSRSSTRQATTQATGDALLAIIRPEDIVVRAGQGPGDATAANSFPAEVLELEFLGSYWRAGLACPALGEGPVTANVSANVARDLSLVQGMSVHIELPPERLHVFADQA